MLLCTVNIIKLLFSSEKWQVGLRILCRYGCCAFVLAGAKIVD